MTNSSINLKKIKLSKEEIPLKGDSSSNLFLEVMIAVSIFMFAITLSGVLSINAMLDNWNESILGSVTVQIMPVNNANSQKAIEETLSHQNKAIKLLEDFEGVEKVTPLDDKQLQKLLQPWLGDEIKIKDLPIPRLIDVKVNPKIKINYMELSEKLAEVSPRATLDSHKLWLSKLISFADGLKNMAIIILGLVIMIASGGIIYVTKSSLSLHKYVIGILHVMGAKDSYIARRFARRTGIIALAGGIIGVMGAIPTIFMIGKLAEKIEGGIISEASLSILSWGAIISLPLLAVILSMCTAYITVKKTLETLM